MKQKLLQILALCVVLFTSTQVFAQNPGALSLSYDDAVQGDQCWDGFNMQNSPILFSYAHSGSQILYMPEQLAEMKGKKINSVSFKCFTYDAYNSAEYTSNMKLYIKEVDSKEFIYDQADKAYHWFDINNDKAVCDMQSVVTDFANAAINGEDVEITFDLSKSSFVYSGKTLLITVVNDSDAAIEEGTIQFYWIPNKKEDPWRTFVYGNDTNDFLTTHSQNLAFGRSQDKWKNAPAVKFTYEDAPVPEKPDLIFTQTFIGGYQDAVGGAVDYFSSSNWDVLPICFNYTHNGVQLIYTAEELASMANSQITQLTFKYYNEGCVSIYDGTIKVYLNEIDNPSFPLDKLGSQTWVPFNQEQPFTTLNYSNEFMNSYCADEVIDFSFEGNPYVYTGKNLVITIVSEANTTIDSGDYVSFYKYDAGMRKNLIYTSHDVDFMSNINGKKAVSHQTDAGHPIIKITHMPTCSSVEQSTIVSEHVVYTQSGTIALQLKSDVMVQVYDISGKIVAADFYTQGNHNINVQRGIYIVKVGNETHKVCVLN